MAYAYPKMEAELPMTCCLGDHPLQNPKVLPCQHSFCTGCIKRELGKEREMFICPKCQLAIPLKEKEVDQLPEDVLYHIMQETKGKAVCVLCKFEDKKTPGTFQCLDCADVLCDQCQKGHTRSSLTRLHRVVSVRDIQQEKYKPEIQVEKLLYCDSHSKPNKPMVLEYYCEQCKCLACQLCVNKEHQPQGHTCNAIDEIHNEKRTAVNGHVTRLLGLKQHVEEFAKLLQQELRHNAVDKEKLENEIHDKANKFIKIIEKVKEETLEKIRDHFDTENTSIQSKLNETKNRFIRIDSLVSYTQAFLKHSAKSLLLQHENEMIKKMADQIQPDMNLTLRTKTIDIGLRKYNYAKTETYLTKKLGKINTTTKRLFTAGIDVPNSLLKAPEVCFFVDVGFDKATDLTMAENADIIAIERNTIHVYSKSGNEKEIIKCNLVDTAWNVVAKGDTLYVSNNEGSTPVLVMDFKGKVKRKIILPDSNNGTSCNALAVDYEDNVYISSENAIFKCSPNESKGKIFIQEGKNYDLDGPFHLCMTPGGELVVSNCLSNTVQVYDKLGDFLWHYKGQGQMELCEPRGVFCDRNDNIYICDFDNDRIQVIRYGVFVGIIEVQGFENPRCITMDEDDNIVCGYNDGLSIAKLKVWE